MCLLFDVLILAKNDKQVSCQVDDQVIDLGTVENGLLEVKKSDGRVGLIPENVLKQ